MTLLVDSNIVIDFLKRPTDKMKAVFNEHNTFLCGIVIAEVLTGARNDNDFRRIQETLLEFPLLDFDNEWWCYVGSLLYTLRKSGIKVPFGDIMISVIALKSGCAIWTLDKHFEMIRSVAMPDLQLY